MKLAVFMLKSIEYCCNLQVILLHAAFLLASGDIPECQPVYWLPLYLFYSFTVLMPVMLCSRCMPV